MPGATSPHPGRRFRGQSVAESSKRAAMAAY